MSHPVFSSHSQQPKPSTPSTLLPTATLISADRFALFHNHYFLNNIALELHVTHTGDTPNHLSGGHSMLVLFSLATLRRLRNLVLQDFFNSCNGLIIA